VHGHDDFRGLKERIKAVRKIANYQPRLDFFNFGEEFAERAAL
jgi:hypothetical protein